jgi:ParB family chromosome partitioning protein
MDLPVTAIVSNLSNEEALLAQASENENRKSLSDYAKGKQYSKIIKEKIFTQESLAKNLNKSRTYVRQLLSFDNIDHRISTAIGNLSNISSRTAYEICKWQQKGEEYINILISLANKLETGEIGEKKLNKLLRIL